MTNQRISKATPGANMPSYEAARESFSWQDAQDRLDGLPDGHLNIAHEAIDRHVAAGHGEQTALRWIAKSGARIDMSYQDLQHLTNKFANVFLLSLSSSNVPSNERLSISLSQYLSLHKNNLFFQMRRKNSLY